MTTGDARMSEETTTTTTTTKATNEVGTYETTWKNWDRTKLLEFGIDEGLVKELNNGQARDMLQGILYLKEKYKMQE